MSQAVCPSYRGREGCLGQMTSLALTRKFQINGLRVPFLGEADSAIRLGLPSWFADMGFGTSDSIWSLLSLF